MAIKKAVPLLLFLVLAPGAFAQVDIESRRTLLVQTGFALKGDEQPRAFGCFWFNPLRDGHHGDHEIGLALQKQF